jgi:hypothetical protein
MNNPVLRTMEKAMVKLGSKVKDKITGFSGIVTGYVIYITGCNQSLVVPKVGKDGSFKEGQWFDDQRLEVDKKAATVKLNNGNSLGCDAPAPKR